MTVEVVSIGSELLRGFTIDTNAAFIGRELFERGYEVSRHITIPDDPSHLDKELRACLARSSTVIVRTSHAGQLLFCACEVVDDDQSKQNTIFQSAWERSFSFPLQEKE